jgi:hypothetical protein
MSVEYGAIMESCSDQAVLNMEKTIMSVARRVFR